MSAWWLLLIVPVAASLGFVACAMFTAGAAADRRTEVPFDGRISED